MSRNDPADVKMKKTLHVLVYTNLILSPLLLLDTQFALLAALVVNAVLIAQFNEIGKTRRAGSNLIHHTRSFAQNFFAQKPAREINLEDADNTLRNIINGGAAVYDELADSLMGLSRN
ncbi:Uncharacterised protein [Legionella wadsworthii]|uniref:Uncharacterized protein n=1 Tax=Legionella wadsworthii TaxID=28088 RepID=A0A378LW87_9GAMM|nr:hypothetical protein [Legionella wadsworthii]STY31295.1 Uncharacterised protein [Legionella wadsworthii]